MEEKTNLSNSDITSSNLNKCPFCTCCFCSEADLQRHLDTFGKSQAIHQQEFQRVHGRLEHGSFGGPE